MKKNEKNVVMYMNTKKLDKCLLKCSDNLL